MNIVEDIPPKNAEAALIILEELSFMLKRNDDEKFEEGKTRPR